MCGEERQEHGRERRRKETGNKRQEKREVERGRNVKELQLHSKEKP